MRYLFALGLSLSLLTACQNPTNNLSVGPQGELIVRYQPGTSDPSKAALRQRFGAEHSYRIMPDAEYWPLGIDADFSSVLRQLQTQPDIKFAQTNQRYSLNHPSIDSSHRSWRIQAEGGPNGDKQWYLEQGAFPEVWKRTRGKGIIVAVIDSGVDPEHPDLKANLLPLIDEIDAIGKKDFLKGVDYARRDGHGHGTHVCGIVGAIANHERGTSGAAPEVKVLPIKVTTADGYTEDAPIAKGIVDAVDQGAHVINLSIGGTDESLILLEAINYAFRRNVTVVIAAGNDGRAVNYPAAYHGVISVGAITHERRVASYSSHGRELLMVAPGGGQNGPGILSTTPTYPCRISLFEGKELNFDELAGTSMAAPQVTAAIALLLSLEPGMPPAQIRTRLAATADEIGPQGYDEYYGFGLLNSKRMLESRFDDQLSPP